MAIDLLKDRRRKGEGKKPKRRKPPKSNISPKPVHGGDGMGSGSIQSPGSDYGGSAYRPYTAPKVKPKRDTVRRKK